VTARGVSVTVAALLALGACSSPGPAPAKRAAEPAGAPTTLVAPAGRLVALGGGGPEGLVADPTTGLVAVALRAPGRLALVDGGSGRVTATVTLPGSARHLALVRAGGPLLVPVEDRGLLLQVGLPTGGVVTRTVVGRGAHDAAAWAGRVFVSDEGAAAVSVVQDGRVVATLSGPQQPGGVAAADGRVGVVDVRAGLLYVYDPATLRPVGGVPAGAGPTHVVADGHGGLVVADTRGGALLRYRLRPDVRLLERLTLPGRPYGLAADPGRRAVWVTLTDRNRLVGLRLTRDGLRPFADLPTVRQPNSVAVDVASGRVDVVGSADGMLQILTPDSP
jgi:DNA-binding beta-propeller fold protein YncE